MKQFLLQLFIGFGGLTLSLSILLLPAWLAEVHSGYWLLLYIFPGIALIWASGAAILEDIVEARGK